jgi:hypothetical protein
MRDPFQRESAHRSIGSERRRHAEVLHDHAGRVTDADPAGVVVTPTSAITDADRCVGNALRAVAVAAAPAPGPPLAAPGQPAAQQMRTETRTARTPRTATIEPRITRRRRRTPFPEPPPITGANTAPTSSEVVNTVVRQPKTRSPHWRPSPATERPGWPPQSRPHGARPAPSPAAAPARQLPPRIGRGRRLHDADRRAGRPRPHAQPATCTGTGKPAITGRPKGPGRDRAVCTHLVRQLLNRDVVRSVGQVQAGGRVVRVAPRCR